MGMTNVNHLQAVQTRIDSIENKLANLLSSQPANNIVINNCHQEHYKLKQCVTSATQTDPPHSAAHDGEASPSEEQAELAENVQGESQIHSSPSL